MSLLADLTILIRADSSGVGQAAQRAAQDVDSAAGRIQQSGDRTKDIGKKMSMGISVPLGAVAAASISTAMDFEASLSRVSAVTGASAAEMEALEAAARKAAMGTKFGATEAADALGELGKAGFSASDAIKGLDPVLALATAGELEMADAADIAATIMNTMGMEAKDLGRITDALAVGATNSATNVEGMGESFKRSAAASAAAGLSVEQASEAIALMADAGFRGETAGTGLNKVIGDLANESSKGAQIFSGFGVELKDAEGNLRSLSAITLDAQKAGIGYNDIVEAFGSDHGPKFASVLGLSADRINTVAAAFEDTEGQAQSMADTMSDNTAGAAVSLASAWEELQLVLVRDTGILDWVRKLLEGLASLVSKVSAANPTLVKLGLAFAAIAAVLGPLLIVISATIGAVVKIATAIKTISLVVKAATLATWAFNAALLANPITWIVLAIVALIAIIVLLVVYWDEVTAAVVAAWDWIVSATGAALDWMLSVMTSVWTTIVDVFTSAMSTIRSLVSAGFQFLLDIFLKWTPLGIIISHWDKIRSAFSSAIDKVKNLVSAGIKKVTGYFDDLSKLPGKVVGWMKGIGSKIADPFKSGFKSAINWIIDKWNGLSFTIPSVNIPGIGKIGGATISTPNVPKLAKGGVIPASPGGQLAVIGEGGEDEAVIPLSKLDSMMQNTQSNVRSDDIQRVQVELNFTGDSDMARMVRKAVRSRGGNPEVVLRGV